MVIGIEPHAHPDFRRDAGDSTFANVTSTSACEMCGIDPFGFFGTGPHQPRQRLVEVPQ
jgi:hypothetical protein